MDDEKPNSPKSSVNGFLLAFAVISTLTTATMVAVAYDQLVTVMDDWQPLIGQPTFGGSFFATVLPVLAFVLSCWIWFSQRPVWTRIVFALAIFVANALSIACGVWLRTQESRVAMGLYYGDPLEEWSAFADALLGSVITAASAFLSLVAATYLLGWHLQFVDQASRVNGRDAKKRRFLATAVTVSVLLGCLILLRIEETFGSTWQQSRGQLYVSIWQFGATAASYWAFAFGATWLLIRSALRDDQDAIRFFWFAVVISGSAMPAISAWKGGVLEIGLGTALPIWLFVFVPAIIIRWLGFRIGGYQPSELKRRSD